MVRRRLIWLLLITFAAAPGAWAAEAFCRLDATPWLGCAAAQPVGSPCACPSGGAAGRVRSTGDEEVFPVASESTKMALGISVDGPVIAFVPRSVVARRDQVATADQQQMLQVYDFFHFRNLATTQPTPSPTPPPPPPAVIEQSLLDQLSGSPAGRGIRPPIPAAAPALGGPASITAPLTAARSFMRGQDIPPAGVGAYGVVALKAKPTAASLDRLGMLCHAFLASLPTQESLPASIPLGQQMLTIWPVDDLHAIAQKSDDCTALLDHYDLYGGISAVQDTVAQGHALDGRGPFLIGWSPSRSRRTPDAVVLVIDMSRFETQASFDEAFLFWQQKVVGDPALWRQGFSVDQVRLAIRDFADHYGSDFLKAIKIGD